MRGSKQYDHSFSVFSEVTSTIESIGSQAGLQHASFGTKRSGLETLRKIGKTICMSSRDTLCHEVKKQFQHDSSFVEAMDGIVAVLTIEEREKMCNLHDWRSTFLQKMEELQGLADGHCVFEELGQVVDKLCGKGEGDDDENEEEEYLLPVVEGARERLYKECFACGVPKSDARSLAILDCFECNGAAKRDARSQAILDRYIHEDFMLINYGQKI
jgi:hypothetical protein